ncbi:hypothetical protein M9458_057250 [Cirrhinus mrigala]|uniref:Uncharacterized protein n=1 Tax=Cirrhinus mrigala TaxID=683832 RepID=A0ABD0MFK0_CIRMR
MPLGMLRSRAAFFAKKPWLTPTASRSSPSTSGYKAAAMCIEGEQEETSDVLPGTFPQTAHPACSPVELSDDFDISSQYGLDLLFEAPTEEQGVSATSEGGHELSEADASSEPTTPVAESQSVADAEMLTHFNGQPRRSGWSGLDDWFLGNNHDSRPRSSLVPFFPGCMRNNDIPISRLSLPSTAVQRGGIRRSPRASKFSSALIAKACMASGQAAAALHAMAILQVY